MRSGRLLVVATLGLTLVASACSSSDQPAGPSGGSGTDGGSFAAEVGSADLYVGPPQHFELGIFQSGGQGVKLVTFGTVEMRFSFLGEGAAAPGPQMTGTYLPAYGTTPSGPGPTLSDPSTARGVYLADVTFDRPGLWQVDSIAEVHGAGTESMQTQFHVTAKPSLPAPGDRALRTDNLTNSSKGVPRSAIDSRALDGAPIPDPELHDTTIAAALAAHHPIVVILGTPTYCQSRFCGPETDGVQALAKKYADHAVFIHIEIWRNFQKSVINKAAADWLYRNGDLVEPWLYVIGADGIIKDRWGPLFEMNTVEQELAALPLMKSRS